MGINHRRAKVAADMERIMLDRQAKADARITIEVFNSRLEANRETWFWPTIGAALASKHHWLIIECDSCGTIVDLDLKMKPRDPDASIRVALDDVRCPRCNGHGRPRIANLSKAPSPATTLGWRE